MRNYLALFLAVLAGSAFAQTTFTETESNETKATANAFTMVPGDSIVGNTTGPSTTVAGPASADMFKVTVGSSAPGIFQRRLTLTTTGPEGHTGTIRGLTPSGGDAGLTASSSATTPAGFVQWYGWGAHESLYYRVHGIATTTGNYTATFSETAVSVNNLGSYAAGSFTFDVVSNLDTEIILYDGSMNLIGQDDNDASTITSSSLGAMNLTAGTYYVAIGRFNTITNIRNGLGISGGTETSSAANNVTDFAGLAICGQQSTTTLTAQLRINGANAGSALGFTPYSMNWYKVQVVPEPGTFMALGLGGLALIRRKRK